MMEVFDYQRMLRAGKRFTLFLTVFLTVACDDSTAINNAPVARDAFATIDEDTILNGTIVAADPDRDVLRFSIAQSPTNGTLDLQGFGLYSYQPFPEFSGTDSFSLTVEDGRGGLDIAMVSIEVVAVNDSPVVMDQAVMGQEDSPIQVPLLGSDVDNVALIYQVAVPPLNGIATITGDQLNYFPDPDFAGEDTLTILVSDGLLTDTAILNIELVAVNDAPSAIISHAAYELRGAIVQLDALASSDPEGAQLTYSWQQLSGPAIIIDDNASPQPTFVAPSAVTRIEIALTVTDGELQTTASTEIGIAGWSRIAASQHHVLALREDGSLWAWGANFKGQLGDGTTVGSETPKLIDNDSVYVSIAVAGHSFALRDDGALFAFGDNTYGALGNGVDNVAVNATPVVVLGGPYSDISAGNAWGVARKDDGTLWSWGINDPAPGALGRPFEGFDSILRDPQPGQIGFATNWEDFHGSGNSTTARKTDGTLWSWGYNGNGELGIGTITVTGSGFGDGLPIQVGSDTDWASFFRGGRHMFAIKDDGTLWAAGLNENGVLGLGFFGAPEPSLVQVGNDSDWEVACGGYAFLGYSMGLRSDGTLWAWGSNIHGERGDSDSGDVATPTQIGTDTNWKAITCGQWSSFAIKNDGTLWSWGRNNVGQLGQGDTVDRNTPTMLE